MFGATRKNDRARDCRHEVINPLSSLVRGVSRFVRLGPSMQGQTPLTAGVPHRMRRPVSTAGELWRVT